MTRIKMMFFGLASVVLAACSKPDAMTYCRALETRDLARDCRKDTSVDGSNAAVFKVRDGSDGRVLLTTEQDYSDTKSVWNRREEAGEMYWTGAPKHGLLIAMPPSLDVVDRDEFTAFAVHDIDRIAEKKDLEARARPTEHPTRTARCAQDGKCSGAGLCATLPSNPSNCIAGFDADCRKSSNCSTDKLCKANRKTGLCSAP